MKIPSLFSKTPQHRRFSFTPRFYDEQEYERREREERIRRELLRQEEQRKDTAGTEGTDTGDLYQHRTRIAGSFRSARRSGSRQSNTSSLLIRFILFTFMGIWVIAYLQYGNVAFYGLFLIIPFYLFLRRNNTNRNSQ
jgi:hypothetical protein